MSLDINSLKSERRSVFLAQFGDPQLGTALWALKRGKAAFTVTAEYDETLCGNDLNINEDEAFAATDAYATEKAPYGDVHYCDDGMRADKKKRFPVNTPERVRAAWSYSHHKAIMSHYTSEQLSRLHSCIASAWRKLISKDGPPSADGK